MSRAPKSATAYPFHTSEIEIIAVPDGEAPEWVRRAWVGVIVPLAVYEPMEWECFGVLSSPKSRLGLWFYRWTGRAQHKIGYVVMADAGVDSLEQTAPDAAQWWREHTPHMLDGTHTLMFEAEVCRRVKAPRPVPAND